MESWILQFPWEEEIKVILQAPITFIIAMILGWGIISIITRLLFGRERALNKSTIEHQRTQIDLLETRLKTVTREEAKQLQQGELSLKGQWVGSRFVLDESLLEVSDSVISHLESEIGTLTCPPNSIAQVEYRLKDDIGQARLAIRRIGSSDEPTLMGSGRTEVLVDENSQFEYVVDTIINRDALDFGINVTIFLLGWIEN